jgi:hypothetical protein
MKKILIISLVLALVLAVAAPTAVMACRPDLFAAQGVISGIDTGTVKQLGHSDNWQVKNRTIQGTFLTGSLGNGAPFSLTYDGVFSLTTQAGHLRGNLFAGGSVMAVNGTVAPLTMVNMGTYSLPMLNITGTWNVKWGPKASGNFQAYMVFVPDADGHVLQVVDSAFVMNGKYTGRW